MGKKDKDNFDLVSMLKMFSPGTAIRLAVDEILRSGMGALIVVDKSGLFDVVEGGFKVNCRFSPQRLVELSKMDGAIILSEDMKKIMQANALLVPDFKITSRETGTRHKAAERTARQIGTLVIAISERRNKVTIYYGTLSYELEKTSTIMRRAMETLQILEKQRELFNDSMIGLNIDEINELVTISGVCEVLQRIEMIKRVSERVKRYLIELGKEGIIVSMRLKELTKDLNKDRELILKDYFKSKWGKADNLLSSMNFDFLLETSNLSRTLFEELHDKAIFSGGYRILGKTCLLEKDIKAIMQNFKTLEKVFNASKESLNKVIKNEDVLASFIQDIKELREKILAGKKI